MRSISIIRVTVLAILLSGCSNHPPSSRTPKHGIPVYVLSDVPMDPAVVLAWVDLRADEWIANRAAWGCGEIHGLELEMLLRAEPIIVHGEQLIWNGHLWTLGYNKLGVEIHATLNYPPMLTSSDLMNGVGIGIVPFDYSYGLRQLPHEWTHTARGEWHS